MCSCALLFMMKNFVICILLQGSTRFKNRSNSNFLMKQNKRLLIILSIVLLLLLIPFIAKQFTDEVNWTLFDFMVAGMLLVGTGLLFEWILRKAKNRRNVVLISVLLFLVLLVVWIDLAVGIFGTLLSGH